MRQLFVRLAVAPGLLALACATQIEEGFEGARLDGDDGGTSSGGSLGGSLITSGTGGSNSSSGSTSMSNGGKSGSSTGAFGGTATAGSNGQGGTAGSTSAGSGGKGGSGGSATAGSSSGGKGGSSGSGSGGSSTGGSAGGPGSTTCAGVPDWTPTTYKIGDTVASTCSGVFAGTCPPGQSHKFECNPGAGVPALPWCTSREPGIGNGWAEAWVDKGQCQ